MKVNISQAAKMAGVERSTFYRHVGEKGISLEDTNTKRPKVDVSELVRVYGDKLKPLEQIEQEEKTKEVSDKTPSNTNIQDQIELHTLREKVKHLESLSRAEKQGLEDQIELLKSLLESERAERNKTTAQLTDQRSQKEQDATRLTALEKTIQDMATAQNRTFFEKLFGKRKAS